MHKRIITFALICCMTCITACCMVSNKSYSLKILNSAYGLSQHDCECILQDKLGFVWIGTYDGLNRFDGKNVEIFRCNPSRTNSIGDNRIIALAEWPERDELWIGTDGGMSRYNMRTGNFISIDGHPEFNDNYISCFMKDDNAMWVGTIGGPYRITITDNGEMSVEQFPMFDGPHKLSPHVHAIARDKNDNIFAAYGTAIFLKSADSKIFVKHLTFKDLIRQIYTDIRGHLWIVTDGGLYLYDHTTASCTTPLNIEPLINNDEHLCRIQSITDNMYLLLASKSVYWITVNDGMYVIEPVTFSGNSFLKDNEMKSMMIDNALNVWITSAYDGVAWFDLNSKNISHYNSSNAWVDKTYIQKILVDRHKRMWVATNTGISVSETIGGVQKPIKAVTSGVYDMYEDSNGIWLSSLSSIYYIPDGDINRLIEIHQMPGFRETGINIFGPYAITGNGSDLVWIGMRNGILKIRNVSGGHKFELNDILSSQPISVQNNITTLFFLERDGGAASMFVGTKNVGLLKCSVSATGNIINPIAVKQMTPECGKHVWSFAQVSSGKIYVGTDCGLRELSVNHDGQYALTAVSHDERINTYKIMSIEEDGKNDLWLNTSQGLLKYDVKRDKVEVLRASDGLSSNILCEGAWYSRDNNMLYVGGIKGLDVLDLNALHDNNIIPKTQITGIKVNSISVHAGEDLNGRVLLNEAPEYTTAIVLKPYENNFSIEFASMHFSNPDKNTYVYKLEGFDDKWTTVDNNTHSATFTNVPPGHYVFKVNSANCDGVMGDEERCLVIDIDAPVYQSWWALLIYILLALFVVYGILRYFTIRQRRKREDLMRQMNHKSEMEIAEAKINYNTNITHELRTPLSLIISPLDELLDKHYSDDFLESRLKMIKANADSLLLLINQFLDFRKVTNEKMRLKIRREHLSELLSGIVKSFTVTAERKSIVLEYCDDLSFDFYWCDRDIIKKICSNLLANAIKYSPQGCHVILHAGMTNTNMVQISVEDNGIGISEEDCEKIFDRFYQVPGTIGGSGIGLNLCKSLAQIHKGAMNVVSHKGEGSIFTFLFPAAKDEYVDFIVEDDQQIAVESLAKVESVADAEQYQAVDKKVVLIIEDNVELRNYVIQLLQSDYKVIAAGNGQEGLTMTIDHIPDLIVCDIMMPIMDGIEYTKRVRQDIRTSHIPVILLTAKVAVESEIEGLTYGADDYIMKPFNPQVLKLRIDNLLKLTSAKARNAAKDVSGTTGEVPSLNERERKFVDNLRKLVTDNMAVPGYGMDDICSAMGMSRMQLHRKITAILNQKPSQFIKELKMKRAYSLLKEKGLNITETMYEVGYSNYSYFSKLFIEVNGISPRELLGMRAKGDHKK